MGHLLKDLRHALRTLAQRPAVTLIAVGSLALGIAYHIPMKRPVLPFLILVCLLAACTRDAPPDSAAASAPPIEWKEEPIPAALASRQVYQPQVLVHGGTTLLVWREKGSKGGSNLFACHLRADGTTSDPVRVNDLPDSVLSWDHDENRASLAGGPGGRIAVAWSTGDSSVRVATSLDHGATFAPSVRLHQDEKPAYHAFPTVAFDSGGVLHAAWIDARDAGNPHAEEPADLYYARVEADGVRERNLTAEEEGSVCGCCRLDMEIANGRMTIAFRYASTDGYRDVYRIEGTADGSFSPLERLGPPMWELQGCPSAGPVTIGGTTLWNEASSRAWRTLSAAEAGEAYTVVLESTDDWAVARPPRQVAGSPPDDPLVLVPGRSSARILRGTERVVAEDLPDWVRSAALRGDELLLIGAVDGEAKLASRPLGTG